MRTLLLTTLCSAFLFGGAMAANDGGTDSPFSLGAGARELSLGGADLATSNPATAPYWNASRLAAAQQFAISGFHSRLYDSDVAYQYLGLIAPTLDYGTIGVGIFRLGIDGIEQRDLNNALLGVTDDNRLGIYLAYGRTLSQYNLGIAFTLEHHSLDTYSATSSPGVNLSFGRRFETGLKHIEHITLALNGKNLLQPSIELLDVSVKYPLAVAFGVTVGLTPNPKLNHRFSLSGAIEKVDGVDPRYSFGLEYDFKGVLFLRGGLRNGLPAAGIGMQYSVGSFDYALIDRDLGSIHMFTLTTSFGTPVNEKRAQRAAQRELEFNKLMNARMVEQNRSLVSSLVNQGEAMLDEGNVLDASSLFDRALFLARASSLDTGRVAELATATQERLDNVSHLKQFRELVDSVEANLDDRDYLSARYFAGLALEKEPNSEMVLSMLAKANDALTHIASQEELIQRGLWEADSLLSYGNTQQSINILKSLRHIAPEDNRVNQSIKKAEFERLREKASRASSEHNYRHALSLLDSALQLFPRHQWCLDLKKNIAVELRDVSAQTKYVVASTTGRASEKLLKEADVEYMAGQAVFKEGELSQAIEHWEKAERLVPGYQSVRKYLVNGYKFMGVELYSNGALREAIRVWQKAASLDPGNIEIKNYITRTETEMRKLKELSYGQR